MNQNHNHSHDPELLGKIERAVSTRQPTGDPTIDRLASTRPQADRQRRDALEARLVMRLLTETQSENLEEIAMTSDDLKPKGKPKRPRRFSMGWVAALMTLAGVALAVINPRFTERGLEFGRWRLASDLLPLAEMTPDTFLLTATAIIQEATGYARTEFAAVEQSGLNGDQLTATALIGMATQFFVDQTKTAEEVFFPSETPQPSVLTPDASRVTPLQGETLVRIPVSRLVALGPQTLEWKPALRVVIMAQLSTPQDGQEGEMAVETPIIASTARIIEASAGQDAAIVVEVDSAEYPILKWFLDSTSVPLLYIASR